MAMQPMHDQLADALASTADCQPVDLHGPFLRGPRLYRWRPWLL